MTTTTRPRRGAPARLALALLTFVFTLLGLAVPAQAHDYIVDSTPAPDATYDALPERIEIEFSAEIIPASPAMLMLDGDGNVIWEVIPELEGRTAITDFPELNDGDYTLAWSLVSSDGHRVEGGIPFTMTAGLTGGPVAEAADGAGTPAESAPTETAPGPLDDVPLWAKIGLAVAALGGAATVLLARSRRSKDTE